MKKYVMAGILALIMIMPIVGASNAIHTNETEIQIPNTGLQNTFNHTVLVEYVGTSKCGNCPTASSQLKSIYNSEDYDFYYISLVANENNKIYSRVKELGVNYVPDVYFDGGYRNILGRQEDEQPYRNAIVQCGERDVPDIDIDVEASWKSNAVIKITVTVQNNEPEEYNGHLRVYIVEPESRWSDAFGQPFNFGLLDIPIDRSLAVPKSQPKPLGDTYTFTRTWFGFLHGFSDITQDNIMVIAAVFDKDNDHAVQTASAEPTTESKSIFQFLRSEKPIMTFFRLIREQEILFHILQSI